MASAKQNDTQKPGPADVIKNHGLSLSHTKLESYSGISDENDRNSNLSPSKSADPTRKKTFKITSVKKGGSGSGDVGVDNDADSIDGLDESQTEDLSSEFYDSSKATDLDMDIQDCMNIPLTPDELTSTTTIVVKQKPDQNSQSRFKVVKIETKEPFRRGKWVCYDFFDTAQSALVTVEKNGSKMMEDSIIQSALSGNLSSSSSVHYVQDVNDSSSNIFIPPVVPVSPPRIDGQHMLSDVFVPIQPAPASQVLSQLDGLTSDVMAPFIAQQVLMSVANVPSSSTSFHNLAQPGHTTMIQSLPHTSLYSFPQNGSSVNLFQNGVAGQTSQMISLPSDAMLAVSGAVMAQSTPATEDNIIHSQAPIIFSGVPVPHSQSQTQISGDVFVPQGVHLPAETASGSVARPGVPASMTSAPQNRIDAAVVTSGIDIGEQMGPGMDESTGSINTLQGDTDGQTSTGLKEAVEAVGDMYMGLEGSEDDVDERINEVAAVLSNLPQRPYNLPFLLDFSRVDSTAYERCFTPIRSPCASPIPPTFLEHYQSDAFQARIPTPCFPTFPPPLMPQYMGPVCDHPAMPVPVSFPYTSAFMPPTYFSAPQHLLVSQASPFAPFGMPCVSATPAFMPVSMTSPSVSSPSRPRSMTMISVPTSSMSVIPPSSVTKPCTVTEISVSPFSKPRSMSVLPAPPDSKPFNMSVLPLPSDSKPRSMSVLPLPSDYKPRSMSVLPLPSDSKPCSMSVLPVPSDYKPRSMSVLQVPSDLNTPSMAILSVPSASRPRSMTMSPVRSDSYTPTTTVVHVSSDSKHLSMTPASAGSKPHSMTSVPLVSKSRCISPIPLNVKPRSMTMIPVPTVAKPRCISPAPHAAKPRSMTMIPVASLSTPHSTKSASVSRSLSVTPKTPPSLSRSLSVTPKTPPSLSRSLSVTPKTPPSVSRSLSVTPKTPPSVSRSLSVTPKTPPSVSRSLSVTPKTPPSFFRSLSVTPKTPSSISRSLSVILKTPPSVSRSLSMTPKTPPSISRSLSVTPKTPPSISRRSSVTPETPPLLSRSSSVTPETPPLLSRSLSLTPETPPLLSRSLSLTPETPPSISRSMSMTHLPSAFMSRGISLTPSPPIPVTQCMPGNFITPVCHPFQPVASSQAFPTDPARRLSSLSPEHPQIHVSPPELTISHFPSMEELRFTHRDVVAMQRGGMVAEPRRNVNVPDTLDSSAHEPPPNKMPSENGGGRKKNNPPDYDMDQSSPGNSLPGHVQSLLLSTSTQDRHSSQPVSFGSKVADAVTVLSPSIERSLQRRHEMQTDEINQSNLSSSRQTGIISQLNNARDASTMLTLDENQELNISSSGRSGTMLPPQLLNLMSPSMMGRRHSVDSNIGRSRPPTFVRTYRDVRWKRVSKPSKLQQLPRISPVENVTAAVAAAANPGGSEAESREYITGTHIIRQRVPIFMTSNDPPDPMGRRFSAGDLIPVAGAGQHWTPNGKCLVIRDILPSKLAQTSSSDDSSSSDSSPTSSSEDVRSPGGSRHGSMDQSERFEFSLIDEDDEDDLTEDGSEDDVEEEKYERKYILSSDHVSDPATSSSSSSNVATTTTEQLPTSIHKIDTSKPIDLRRLVLQNTLHQKAVTVQPGTLPSTGTLPHTVIPTQVLLPVVAQSAALSSVTQSSAFPATQAHALPATHSNIVYAVPQPLVYGATQPSALPVIMGVASVPANVPTVGTHPVVVPTTVQPIVVSLAAQPVMVPVVTQPSAMSTTPYHVTTPSIVLDTQQSPVASVFGEQKQPASQPLEYVPDNSHLYHNLSELTEISDSHTHLTSQTAVPRPTSPCEMPWVMTSTKIADANVYVSSSHSPNSHMSVRSAHWISPRSVEGTIPINLEDAKAIRVETVSVPSTPGSDPLQFQKVSYSAGFIISSAQWVAPTEVTQESSCSGEIKSVPSVESSCSGDIKSLPSVESSCSGDIKSLPSVESGLEQTDLPHPDSVPSSSSQLKKVRRKYVIQKAGITQQPVVNSSVNITSSLRRPKPKCVVVTVKDDYPSICDTNYVIPSLVTPKKDVMYTRKTKRRFDIDRVSNDRLDLLESELSTQLMLLSVTQPSSPSKRRFIVHNFPHDPLNRKVSDSKSLSPTVLNKNTWSFVAKEFKDSTLKSVTDFPPLFSPTHGKPPDPQKTTAYANLHRDKHFATLQSEDTRIETQTACDRSVLSQSHQPVTEMSQQCHPVPDVSHALQTVPDMFQANISALDNAPITDMPHANISALDNDPITDMPHASISALDSAPVTDMPHADISVLDNAPVTDMPHADISALDNAAITDMPHAHISAPDVEIHQATSKNATVEYQTSINTAALTQGDSESGRRLENRSCPASHTTVRTDTEDDERFAKENEDLLQIILKSLVEESESQDTTQCGGSTVAIDNKIEQAMDLVKRHLMYAVREEVEILKQQIGEMMDRIGQLEYENTVLRSEAKPETLSKLLQPRLTQPQTALPSQSQSQPASMVVAAASQQPTAPQIQPSQQQHVASQQQQAPLSQVGQPPSTT